MPVIAAAVNPTRGVRKSTDTSCKLQVRAKLISLNGGVVLAACIAFTAFFAAALLTERAVATQTVLFGLLMLMAWLYLLDGATERLSLVGDAIERSSLFGRRLSVKLDDLDALLLVHEGLNQEVGIESLTARYRDGHAERLPLGPCWQRHELEQFLASVEQAMGNVKLLETVR